MSPRFAVECLPMLHEESLKRQLTGKKPDLDSNSNQGGRALVIAAEQVGVSSATDPSTNSNEGSACDIAQQPGKPLLLNSAEAVGADKGRVCEISRDRRHLETGAVFCRVSSAIRQSLFGSRSPEGRDRQFLPSLRDTETPGLFCAQPRNSEKGFALRRPFQSDHEPSRSASASLRTITPGHVPRRSYYEEKCNESSR